MITTALYITIGMVMLAVLLNTYRLLRGPDAPDRVLALDTLYINAIALIIRYAPVSGSGPADRGDGLCGYRCHGQIPQTRQRHRIRSPR
jgi:multicomponent K+:H+ antiporter subunit F